MVHKSCANCSASYQADSRFCAQCGESLEGGVKTGQASEESDFLEEVTTDAIDQWLQADSNARMLQAIANVVLALGLIGLGVVIVAIANAEESEARWWLVGYGIGLGLALTVSYAGISAVKNVVANGAHSLRLQTTEFRLRYLDGEVLEELLDNDAT